MGNQHIFLIRWATRKSEKTITEVQSFLPDPQKQEGLLSILFLQKHLVKNQTIIFDNKWELSSDNHYC